MRKWIWKLIKGALWSEAEGRLSTRKVGGLLLMAAPHIVRWISEEFGGIEVPQESVEAVLMRLADWISAVVGYLVIRARNDDDKLRQEIRKARVAAVEAATRPVANLTVTKGGAS